MPDAAPALPRSEHFQLQTLAQGIYAAIGSDSGGAYSNAGIIDLGDRTLIFDTFNTPQAAQDLRAAAEALTGRQAGVVIISHVHSDHWMGNQAFADHALLLTTCAIRDAMLEWAEYLREQQADPKQFEAEVQKSRERLQRETDPRWRASLELFLGRARHMRAALEIREITLPCVTFDGALAFHGPQRGAELRVAAPGHTDSDAYLILPGEGIAFLGDLGFFARQPFMAYCDPQAWAAHLQAFEDSDLEIFVPGHGPVGTRADLTLQRRYLEALEGMVAKVIAAGGSAQDALREKLPPPFDGWLNGGMAHFETNVRFAFERLSGGG